ncbi:hypothetical protein K438DRAFT_2181750 [Mycena galopus ATCC 62051]|nr:hypothetical protein K438DRAFT_2181750 [Mycena galopus ATCC 62051]
MASCHSSIGRTGNHQSGGTVTTGPLTTPLEARARAGQKFEILTLKPRSKPDKNEGLEPGYLGPGSGQKCRLSYTKTITIFGKGGGKCGKHEPVFENLHGGQFGSIPFATAAVQTKQFVHIPPVQFLCLWSAPARLFPTGIELTQEDVARFKTLAGVLRKFNEAMKLFRKRGKKKVAAGGESGDDDGEDSE